MKQLHEAAAEILNENFPRNNDLESFTEYCQYNDYSDKDAKVFWKKAQKLAKKSGPQLDMTLAVGVMRRTLDNI